MLRPDRPQDPVVDNLFTRNVIRFRYLSFAFIALLMLASVNGHWRIHVDSAIYRGVGQSLAKGRGYSFGGMPHDLVHPGLPFLLAGLQKIFGPSGLVAWPETLTMLLLAVLTLWTTYALVRRFQPEWVALCVTIGLALNQRFFTLSHEIMTDVPFLLGMQLALLGWERMRQNDQPRLGWATWGLIVGGLGLAASMRPTFWVLALAWVGASLWGFCRGPRRRPYAVSIVAMGLVMLVFALIDPRGGAPLAGGYEQMFFELMPKAWEAFNQQYPLVFGRELTDAFFGEHMSPVAPLLSAMLIGSVLFFVSRINLLWTLIAVLTVLVTLIFSYSSTTRYFLMIVPILWLGWIHLGVWLTARLPEHRRGLALGAFCLLGLLPNFGGIAALIVEQRQSDFLSNYRRGQFVPMVQAADMIREHVPPGARVIGPNATVLTYLSGVYVTPVDSLLAGRHPDQHLRVIREFDPQYVIFPQYFYRRSDERLIPLLERRLLTAGEIVAQDGELYLARAVVVRLDEPSELRWQSLPIDRRPTRSTRIEPSSP